MREGDNAEFMAAGYDGTDHAMSVMCSGTDWEEPQPTFRFVVRQGKEPRCTERLQTSATTCKRHTVHEWQCDRPLGHKEYTHAVIYKRRSLLWSRYPSGKVRRWPLTVDVVWKLNRRTSTRQVAHLYTERTNR